MDTHAPASAPPYGRRAFLGRLAAGLGVTAVLAACGGEGGSGTAGAEVVEASSCAGYDALSDQDLQIRRTLGYVDDSVKPGSRCDTCRFFTAQAGSPCGGCQVFAGPVAPSGYCTSWAPPAA